MDSEREAFQDLLDDHGAVVLGTLRRLCGNPHDADDVFQEVAVRVWRNIGARPRLRNPRGWLLTIAYRAFVDHRARQSRTAALDEDDETLARGIGDPVVVVERAEQGRRLAAAVERLPDAVREVVVLHYTGGLSLRQVAAATGMSVGTVKSRLNAGSERLRRGLP